MKIHRLFPEKKLTAEDLQTALLKAKASGAQRVWCAASVWPQIYELLAHMPMGDFEWLVEAPVAQHASVATLPQPDRWVFCSSGTEAELETLAQHASETPFWLLVRPEQVVRPHQLLQRLPAHLIGQIYFEFLPWRPEWPKRYTVGEVRRLIAAFEQRFAPAQLLPPPGLEVWDDRMDPRLEVEPLVEPRFRQLLSREAPRISVIIPTYNNRLFLHSVVRALLQQAISPEQFELIVIDDGSSDGSEQEVLKLIAEQGQQVNFIYGYLPRPSVRTSGDNHYRAGIARNLGARWARGTLLQFLDSDIVVAPEFLARVLAQAEKFDVIQCERYHIQPRYCETLIHYDEINVETQTFVEDAAYWKPFFATDDWMSIGNFWKHTCSYCLTVKRLDFEAVGRFKRTFTTYGFEDVDLGYELAKRGASSACCTSALCI
jgi:GT2 family glycosyltransferase